MTIDRRTMIGAALGATAGAAFPQTTRISGGDGVTPWPPAEHIRLWPDGRMPNAPPQLPTPDDSMTGDVPHRELHLRGVADPVIGVYRPAYPDGRALLVLPGGGYEFLSVENEGINVARALGPRGVTVFVLAYRLPGEGWAPRPDVPLQDAQRAMRLIRAGAARLAIDPVQVGVLGFSAGGHLAGSLATRYDTAVYAPIDAADRQSARPAFGGLIYAVSNMDAGRSHGGSRANLLGPAPDAAAEARYAVDRSITAATPPLFVLHCEDDDTVPFANGLDLFAAARAAGVPAEGHFFRRGGHGFGLGLPPERPAALWPQLFDRWVADTLHDLGARNG